MPRAARIESSIRQHVRGPRVRSASAMECNPSASAPEHIGYTSVVVARLDDDEAVPRDRVDEAMLVGDPPRPVAREVLTEWLRLADADSGLAKRLADQPVDTSEHFAIVAPRAVVGPRVAGERDPQSAMSGRSDALPAEAWATPLSRRSAFAGDRIR